jgi:hypothetical protein
MSTTNSNNKSKYSDEKYLDIVDGDLEFATLPTTTLNKYREALEKIFDKNFLPIDIHTILVEAGRAQHKNPSPTPRSGATPNKPKKPASHIGTLRGKTVNIPNLDELIQFYSSIVSLDKKPYKNLKIFNVIYKDIRKRAKSQTKTVLNKLLNVEIYKNGKVKYTNQSNSYNITNINLKKEYEKIHDLATGKIPYPKENEIQLTINTAWNVAQKRLSEYYTKNRGALRNNLSHFNKNYMSQFKITNQKQLTQNLNTVRNLYNIQKLSSNRNLLFSRMKRNFINKQKNIIISGKHTSEKLDETFTKIRDNIKKAINNIKERYLSDLASSKTKKQFYEILDEFQLFTIKLKEVNPEYGILSLSNKNLSRQITGLQNRFKNQNEKTLEKLHNQIIKQIQKSIPLNKNLNLKKKFEQRPDLYQSILIEMKNYNIGKGRKELNIANKISKENVNYFKKQGKLRNNDYFFKKYNITEEYLKKIKNENMQNLNSDIQDIKVKYVKGLVNAREKYLQDAVREYLSYLRNPRKEGGMKLKNIDKNYKNTVSEINKGYGSGFIKKFKPFVSKYLREEEEKTRRKIRILKSRIRSRLLRERSKRRRRKSKSPQKK